MAQSCESPGFCPGVARATGSGSDVPAVDGGSGDIQKSSSAVFYGEPASVNLNHFFLSFLFFSHLQRSEFLDDF